MHVEPFEVPSFSPEQLSLLKDKLSKTTWPNELQEDVGWDYGAPTWAVEPVAKAWLEDYDWEVARAKMNRWHHYHGTLQDLKIHFIHERSSDPDAIPILLLHGWPSTFYEFHDVIDNLRDGAFGGQVSMYIKQSLDLLTYMDHLTGFSCHCAQSSWFWILGSTQRAGFWCSQECSIVKRAHD